jgi:hypothetical protein
MRTKKPVPIVRRIIQTALWLLLVAFLGFALVYLGTRMLQNDRELQLHGLSLNARVTALEDRRNSSENTYHLKYSFNPDGLHTYSYADVTATLRDLWSPVTAEQFERSQKTRLVEVIYLPSDPWVNHPRQGQPANHSIDGLAMIFIGIFFWVVAILLLIYRLRTHFRM